MKNHYTAVVTTESGRAGHARSDDKNLDLQFSIPKEMGGPGGTGTNPEQLFAAGYSACFSSALEAVARKQGVKTGRFTMTGRVSLNQSDDEKYFLSVELEGSFPELGREQALALMRSAHEVCPYSNATRGNIEVRLSVA